ncbi:hypothetical protein [Streptomyces sp. NPDC001404]|uniref:hypothetical protein n=1 Tax=Streptomyces sp. NPDC001404 TaxID=3364571 RepID=UPI003675A633
MSKDKGKGKDRVYYRRGHWVRVRTDPPQRRTGGAWIALAVAAVVGWGLLNGGTGDGSSSVPAPQPSAPATASP